MTALPRHEPSNATSDLKADVQADVRTSVRRKYGDAAQRVIDGDTAAACCGSSACCGSTSEGWDPITANLYDEGDRAGVPAAALLASLGCGNPTALAELHRGETVLDLGSGGGIDVLLSARRVGPTGKVYGLDMTDEMLALANENKRRSGADNVEFLKGEIEQIPLPDSSVDVVISNCVINLSADKARVLREAFRVLKPGGRFAVSDVVVRGDVPADVRHNMELWIGCVAGALEELEYRDLLADAGFRRVEIEPTRVYQSADAEAFLGGSGLDPAMFATQIEGRFMSAFIRGTKPAGNDSLLLRAANDADLAAVERLLIASDLPTVGLAAPLRDFVVAEARGAIVGVVGLEVCGDHALLRSAAVAPEWRGRGIGRQLVDRIITDARTRGVRALYLLTTTAESYFPAFGFETTAREAVPDAIRQTSEFREACPASATAMRLTLVA